LVKDGRVRSLEVRKVDGEPLDGSSPVAAHLRHAGFVDSYRGVVLRSS
jgi:hypothetical protein